MKNIMHNVIKYIFSFIILILLFNILLYLACLFDSKLLEKNVKDSSITLNEQGMFYKISKHFNIINNNSTDSVIVNEAYSVDNKVPFESYMKVRKNYKNGQTRVKLLEDTGEGLGIIYDKDTNEEKYIYNPVQELNDFLDGNIHYSINYGRYWHGYLPFYRTLLIFFNLDQIRLVLFGMYICLFLYFIYLLNKRFNRNIAIIFGMSLLCSGYFSASFSLESTPIFLLMMVSAIILLKRIDKIKNIYLYIFIIGCISNYVDYLTVPLITLGILINIYLLKIFENKVDYKKCLYFLIKCSIIWVIGYSLTWVTKWILYDLFIDDGKSMLKIGFTQIFYRTKRINEIVGVDESYIYSIINIIGRSSLYIILTTGVLLKLNNFKVISGKIDKYSLLFILVAFYPILWYFILANHTVMHDYFTYRHSIIYMVGMLLFINKVFFNKDNKE